VSIVRRRGLSLVPPEVLAERPALSVEVYQRRARLGWTQQNLADRCGLTQPEVSDLETGKLVLGERRLARLRAALQWED
jgi:transcriptional regulator with XRE-family HTH domain